MKAWPVYEGPGSTRTRHFTIHASDHREALAQMARAYKLAVERPPSVDPGTQLAMPWMPRRASWPPRPTAPENDTESK